MARKMAESVTLPQDEIELQPFENEHDCDDENPAMKESVTTKTSIWQRHRCLIISIITVMVISSIAVTLAVVLVPRIPGPGTVSNREASPNAIDDFFKIRKIAFW